MLAFQAPSSEQTLDDGLAEYYASRDDLVGGRGISEAAREFFRCHDAVHVVFGCDTSLTHEAMVKLWSLFGTTIGFGVLRYYRLPEAQEIYTSIGLADTARTGARTLTIAPRVIARCRRMRRPWPWDAFEGHRAQPLRAIRADYGIEVLVVA